MRVASAIGLLASWEKPGPGLDVAGQTPKSPTALARLRQICETQPAGRDQIDVVDQLERPQLARDDELGPIRTLARKPPKPTTQVNGDPDVERVLGRPRLIPAHPARPR